MAATAKPIWPSKAVVKRYLELGKEQSGMKVPGFRVDPTTGAIEVFESAGGDAGGGAYDRWKAKQDKKAA